MNKEDLPGYREALRLGYTLARYTGNGAQAWYDKGDITLVVKTRIVDNPAIYPDYTAELFACPYRMIQLHTGEFSFPNRNFPEFERQITEVVNVIKKHLKE